MRKSRVVYEQKKQTEFKFSLFFTIILFIER